MKKKLLLPIYLILSLVLIVCAVVMSLTRGINLGVDFNGGKLIEIKLEENANTAGYEKSINEVLKKYNLSIDSATTQDRYTDSYYQFKINTKEISNEHKASIKNEIATKLNIDAENISDVMNISGNVTQRTLINISIAVVCVFIVFMIAGIFRYGIMGGLSILFTALHTMIINFALILITGLQINIPTIVSIVITSIFSLVIFALILEKVREGKNKHHNEKTDKELFADANKKSLTSTIIIASALVVFAIVSLFSSLAYIRLFALALIVCTMVAVYSANLISVELASLLYTIKTDVDKQKLSKNVETKNHKK